MRNLYLLETPKPSRLHLGKSGLVLCDLVFNPTTINSQNIYITSDEEIKYNDYYLGEDGLIYCLVTTVNSNGKKIILTTDKDLIKDGVQAIDEDFLQWFVKNSSCEYVEIKSDWEFLGDDYRHGGSQTMVYKIIIPQEPKQEPNFYEKLKEYFENTPREKVLEDWNKSAHLDNVGPTIDEFIENSNEERLKEAAINCWAEGAWDNRDDFTDGFVEGAKWKDEKMYTYDELRRIAYNAYCLGQLEEPTENKYNLWIQQFKKK
jgi:hypothetical protein